LLVAVRQHPEARQQAPILREYCAVNIQDVPSGGKLDERAAEYLRAAYRNQQLRVFRRLSQARGPGVWRMMKTSVYGGGGAFPSEA
jgi:hypothetical protein